MRGGVDPNVFTVTEAPDISGEVFINYIWDGEEHVPTVFRIPQQPSPLSVLVTLGGSGLADRSNSEASGG